MVGFEHMVLLPEHRECFLILCVPASFVELTTGMEYSYKCSETFGKSLLLQKQTSHCGRQRLQEGEWVHTTAQILHKLPRSLQQLRNKQNQSSFSSFLLQYVAELVCMIGFHLPRKTLQQRTQLQRCTMLNLTTKYTTPSVSDDA